MIFTLWFLIVGVLLIVMALATSILKRLPLTSAMFYLAAGLALGPLGAAMLDVDVIRDARLLERFTEVVVIVSLFTAGLKLRLPLTDARWRPAILMASVGMVITVGGSRRSAFSASGSRSAPPCSSGRCSLLPTPCSRRMSRWKTPTTARSCASA